jgi:hypothetical protein
VLPWTCPLLSRIPVHETRADQSSIHPHPTPPPPQGTVAWISHLGHRAAWLQRFLLAKGFPSNAPTKNLATFFIGNVPTALGFVLPHSLLPPKKLYALMHSWSKSELVHSIPIAGPVVTHFLRLPGSGRLVYNAIAAGTLHFLLFHFAPLATPVVAVRSLVFPKSISLFADCPE